MIKLKSNLLFFMGLFLCANIFAFDIKSNYEDRKSLDLTIYSNNMAFVKEVRQVKFPKDISNLCLQDIPYSLIPNSIFLVSLNYPKDFEILEQEYRYDLGSNNDLLNKFIGKEVKVVKFSDISADMYEQKAVLLKAGQSKILSIDNEIYLNFPGEIVVNSENVITKPCVSAKCEVVRSKSHEILISYLVDNMNWDAGYNLFIKKNDRADLKSWMNITNNSGLDYTDANIKVIAGDVKREEAGSSRYRGFLMKAAVSPDAANAATFREKAVSQYYSYEIPYKTSINNGSTKQISFLDLKDLEIQEKLVLKNRGIYLFTRYRDPVEKEYFDNNVKIKNTTESNLPKGNIRVYKQIEKNNVEFIGESSINNTAKDEEIEITLGKSFDVYAKRKQMDYKKISNNIHVSEWQIKIFNKKDKVIRVEVVDFLSGDWNIMDNNTKYKKLTSSSIKFDLNIKPNSEVIIKYSVKTKV
ncbi:DUF4139 domain-containing protein [bacterium]